MGFSSDCRGMRMAGTIPREGPVLRIGLSGAATRDADAPTLCGTSKALNTGFVGRCSADFVGETGDCAGTGGR